MHLVIQNVVLRLVLALFLLFNSSSDPIQDPLKPFSQHKDCLNNVLLLIKTLLLLIVI